METSVPFGTATELLIYLFITLAMLCVGMSASVGDFRALLRDRARTSSALLANVIVPPIVALVLITFIPMEESAAAVLMLLAFAPGGINAVQFSAKAPGQVPLAGALLFLLSVVGLITAPVAARTILPPDAAIGLPAGELTFRVIVLVLAPLLIGMALRASAPPLAERLYKPAMLISTLAFIASVVTSLSQRQDAVGLLGTPTVLAMLLFILALMAAGWLAGGPEPDGRQVLSVATNLRNVGLVYVLVEGCCDGGQHAAAVLAFMALMVPTNLILTIACGVLRKRRTKPANGPGEER